MPDRRSRKQTLAAARRRLTGVAALLLLVLPLGACGKKPDQVDPPPGAEQSTFPRTYPDPATDPKP